MTTFMMAHPVMTFVLAVLAMITIDSIAENIAKAYSSQWEDSKDEQK